MATELPDDAPSQPSGPSGAGSVGGRRQDDAAPYRRVTRAPSPEGGPKGPEAPEGVAPAMIPPPMVGTVAPVVIPPTPPAVIGALLILVRPPPNAIAAGEISQQTEEVGAELAALADAIRQATPKERVSRIHELLRRLRNG
jgi:hypothetical protein